MEHSRIKKERLIEKYTAGQLKGSELRSFEAHYQNCPACQNDLHRLLKERDFAGRFVLGALSSGEAAFFEKHYFLCASCFEEVKQNEILRLNVLDSVRRKSYPLFKKSESAGALWEFVSKLKSWLSSPYIAFASLLLMLVLIYPAWRGLHTGGKDQLVALHHPGFVLQSSAETVRGAPKNTITLEAHEDIFLLNFNLPVKVDPQNIYGARIVDVQNHLIGNVERVWPGGSYAVFSLVCYRKSFVNGDYRLIVSEADASGKESLRRFVFPFRLQIKK